MLRFEVVLPPDSGTCTHYDKDGQLRTLGDSRGHGILGRRS